MRKLRRTDEGMVSIWIIIAIIAVVAIIVIAAIMVEADSPNLNTPDDDTEYQIGISYKFDIWNWPAGIVVMKSLDFKVMFEDFDYEAYKDSGFVYFSISKLAFWDMGDDNKFEFKLQLRVTGPNAFQSKDTWKLEYDIGENNNRDIDFATKYCYIKETGTYRVEAKLWVHAPAEDGLLSDDLEHALIWTHTKVIKVG